LTRQTPLPQVAGTEGSFLQILEAIFFRKQTNKEGNNAGGAEASTDL
jgi:hypothetical protein